MLLIDAANIVDAGGAVLLKYLVKKIDAESIDYKVIISKALISDVEIPDENKIVVNINILNRGKIFKQILVNYQADSILCFGNYPPPFKLKSTKSCTYFHRPHLLKGKNTEAHNFRQRLSYFLKRKYLYSIKENTNIFLVQNDKIKNGLINGLRLEESKVEIVPFFDEEKIQKLGSSNKIINKIPTFIYVSKPYPHKNHNNLLKAWSKVVESKHEAKLILTIPESSVDLLSKIDDINRKGGNIVNIGMVKHERALKEISQSDVTIFPSTIETFGLGLAEGVILGTKLVTSNLPYVGEIVVPSDTFDPYDTDSIYNSIIRAIENNLNPPKLLVRNEIDKLIELIK